MGLKLFDSDLFALRGKLPPKKKALIEIIGAILFLLVWWSITQFTDIKPSILPSPIKVITCIPEMFTSVAPDPEYHLIRNTGYSIWLNLLGYVEATIISLILGFLIGLIPLFRALSERILAALRFLPLTAFICVLIAWFGIGLNVKIQFLALGIVVYMLPVVVQRIDEVPKVLLNTAKTLGATKWQTVKTIYMPDVLSRFSDDIRVLTAISWTYIVIAEMVNSSDGGIGALVFVVQKQNRMDMVFAIVVIILLIGIIQDRLMLLLDKFLIKHKYA